MELIPLLLDVGNIGFFLARIPQMIRVIHNRKTLKDLSPIAFTMFMIFGVPFVIVSLLTNAYLSVLFGVNNIIFNAITIYWIFQSQKNLNVIPTTNISN